MAKSFYHPVIVIFLLITVLIFGAKTQNAYRPYRPISNIFGSLFRPGVGPPPPPPPPHPSQAWRSNNNVAPPNGVQSTNDKNSHNDDPEKSPGHLGPRPASDSGGNNLPPPPSVPQGPRPNQRPQEAPSRDPRQHQHQHQHPPRRPVHRPRHVPLRGAPPRILLRPQGPHGPPLIGPLPKSPQQTRPPPHPQTKNQNDVNSGHPSIPSLGHVLSLVSTISAGSSTPPSTTSATHASPSYGSYGPESTASDELLAPSTDPPIYIIDELNLAIPAVPALVHGHHSHHDHVPNSLEDNFLPPPTAASLVGSPPGLDSESRTLSPTFRVQPRGHSAPVIISQIPVKSFQSSNQVVQEPMPDKLQHHDDPEDHHGGHHQHLHHPHDLSTADSQISEQLLTPYPQPRFYDPVASRTFDSQRLLINAARSRSSRQKNSKRFHFSSSDADSDQKHHGGEHHRENRLLHNHAENHHHDHDHSGGGNHNEIIERIDEVRELVDCGGRDLGFCDMSSKYPGHMMGNLMSDCQELVYSGFVPVPEDLEELGDSNPIAKYSNSSKSAVRAQTGSWSWKPYTYEKKQICDSELRFIRPGYARDATGKWQVVVQTEDLPQRVAIDLCHAPEKPCHLMSDCGRKSQCIQRYNFQHLLAVDPDNMHKCPTIRAFKFPSSCVCHIEFPNHQQDYY